MDTYKEVFYAAGVPALISTGITLLYLLLKAYQFAVYALPHQAERRLAAAMPGGRQQVHGSVAREKGYQEIHEQVPGNLSNEYGAELQQPSGTIPLSRGWENICIATRRNAEEHSVEPFVRENAKRLQGRGDRHTKDNDGQRSRSPHDDSAGVPAQGGRWPNAENEQSRNDGRASNQERSDTTTYDGISGRRDPEKQVSDVSIQTDTCDTLYVTKNTLTAYTIAVVQNSQALQYDQMHAALQSARNQSSLETPLKSRRAVVCPLQFSCSGITYNPRCLKSVQIIHRTRNLQPQRQTNRLTLRFRAATLRIVQHDERIRQEQLPLPADVTSVLSMRYLRAMNLTILGIICLTITNIHIRTT